MKILPPTLRESNRYIAFGITSETQIIRQELINEIHHSTTTLLGDVGSCELGLRLFSFKDHKGIIRCTADTTWKARAVLASVSSIKGTRIRLKVYGMSGTVRGATEKYLLTENINEAEPKRKGTQKSAECNIVINTINIRGNIINYYSNKIDLLPNDRQYMEIIDRSDTRYIGITVFDLKDKEID
jgi:ribonuclease P/MRP protein subunit POP5